MFSSAPVLTCPLTLWPAAPSPSVVGCNALNNSEVLWCVVLVVKGCGEKCSA